MIERKTTGLLIKGKIDFNSVTKIFEEGKKQIANWPQDSLQIDFSGVEYSNNSGLALLIGWLRLSKKRGKTLYFSAVPATLMNMAQVCGINMLLPLTEKNNSHG